MTPAVFVALALTAVAGAANDTLVIEDVTVVPVDRDELLEHRTVTIRQGIIEQIVDSTRARRVPDATIVDGRGKFLAPGLVDAHLHIVPLREILEDADDRFAPLRSEAAAPYPYDSRVLFGVLAAGVTTVFHLGGGGETVLELRELVDHGKILGPRIVAGKRINGPPVAVIGGSTKAIPASSVEQPHTAAHGRAAVLEAKANGYDFIKAYQHLNRETYDAIINTARAESLVVMGHLPELGCPKCTERSHPFELPMNNIAHAEELGRYAMETDLDPKDMRVLSEWVLRSRMGLTPTLITSQKIVHMYVHREVPLPSESVMRLLDPVSIYSWEPSRVRYLSEKFRRQPDISRFPALYDYSRVLTRQLWREGVLLTVGTDAPLPGVPYGFSVVDEMMELTAIGLSPYETLRAATLNAHRLIGDADNAGAVRSGQRADLLLLEANPLEDIANVRRVVGIVVRGRWLSAAHLEKALEENIAYYERIDRSLGLSLDRSRK